MVCAGYSHSCAVLDDSTLKCWGSNAFGQIGAGGSVALGTSKAQMGNNLPTVDLRSSFPTLVQSVACGHSFTCAMSDVGLVKCFGHNSEGQLGLGDKLSRGQRPVEMGPGLPSGATQRTIRVKRCAVSPNMLKLDLHRSLSLHVVSRWSAVDFGDGSVVVAVAAGREHACVVRIRPSLVSPVRCDNFLSPLIPSPAQIMADGLVKCWGSNEQQQLGYVSESNCCNRDDVTCCNRCQSARG